MPGRLPVWKTVSVKKSELVSAITPDPYTRNFRHLAAIPRHWFKKTSYRDVHLNAVPVRERIKWWNVVPGDQIRVRGEKDNVIHQVLSVNKFMNRVYLKGSRKATNSEESEKLSPEQRRAKAQKELHTENRSVHYSRCQLFLGNFSFPVRNAPGETKTLPVFAERIGTTKPIWNAMFGRWDWRRIVKKTAPSIPAWSDRAEPMHIPWPQPAPLEPLEPSLYDTTKNDALSITYKLPELPPAGRKVPRVLPESIYLQSVFFGQEQIEDSNSMPVEVYLAKELSNPHSSTKKRYRYEAYQLRKKTLLDAVLKKELKDLKGRTKHEAKAEAIFKWRQQIEAERKSRRKMRWKHKDTLQKAVVKKAKKEVKEIVKRQRLTDLVLADARNQIIPSPSSSVPVAGH